MDKIVDLTTEEKILNAAIETFIKEGFSGARMQAIADTAGINKAMLHYYFRTKGQLFQKVFELSYIKMHPKLEIKILENNTICATLYNMVDVYLDFLNENPFLPGLIISTLNHHPEFLKKIPRSVPQALFNKMQKAMQTKEIKKIDPVQVMTSIISLCIAPYAAKRMMMHMSGQNEKEYKKMLEEKKIFIKEMIKHMIH
jgi:TetR/AcrR family transcriptional regulator